MGAWIAHWFFTITGARNEAGPVYGFWSGFGGATVIFTGFVSWLVMHWRHVNCHVRGCPRIGRHHVEGTSYVVCRRHLPGGEPTHQDVLDAHHAATKGDANR